MGKKFWLYILLVNQGDRNILCHFSPQDTTLATPYRIILIGDPQIIDEYSYGRRGILQKISEIFPDMYMHKNWENIGITFSPDAIIFMGDLLDGGREWNDEKYEL